MHNPAIQIYTSNDGQVQLHITLDHETLWLTQAQISELFDTSTDNVSLHLKNIFKEGELNMDSTTEDYSVVRKEGKREVNRNLKHYNLDAIISVGYRVNSQRATQFRIWATQTLKQHLVQGYTLNQKRLQERGIEFKQAFNLLTNTLHNHQLITEQGLAVVEVINDYARSWSLLQGYDDQSLEANNYCQVQMQALDYDDVLKAISQLKNKLMQKNEATELFAYLRPQSAGNGLASALATIEQGFGGEWFYPNVASRGANLLYFVIKNHPFTDGNKRTGAFLFLWYLRSNQHLLSKPVEFLINDNTLVALTLLVAESMPEQKELMIRLIEHFILLQESSE